MCPHYGTGPAAAMAQRRVVQCHATSSPPDSNAADTQQQQQPAAADTTTQAQQQQQQQADVSPASSVTSSMEGTTRRKARTADSTDPVASFLSRRFGWVHMQDRQQRMGESGWKGGWSE